MVNRTQEQIMCAWKIHGPPLLSVCCITYNHEAYIRAAIDSFLMQESDFPFEIIIHDDASLDGTTEIVNEYSERYPDIIRTIIQTENQYSKAGLINQRLVFPHAKGKYIALCDGDDYWTDKTKIQKQVDFLESNPEYVITYTDCQTLDDVREVNIKINAARNDLESVDLKKATPIFTLTTCFRNVINDIPQDLLSARHGDLVTWSLLGSYGKGKYMPDILPSVYRVHDAGIHSKISYKNKQEMALITRASLFAYYKKVGDRELSLYYKYQILKSILLSMGLRGLYQFFSKIILVEIRRAYGKVKRNL